MLSCFFELKLQFYQISLQTSVENQIDKIEKWWSFNFCFNVLKKFNVLVFEKKMKDSSHKKANDLTTNLLVDPYQRFWFKSLQLYESEMITVTESICNQIEGNSSYKKISSKKKKLCYMFSPNLICYLIGVIHNSSILHKNSSTKRPSKPCILKTNYNNGIVPVHNSDE